MNNAKVNKSIKKVMQKLVGFALKYPALKASAELKLEHNSIWVQSSVATDKFWGSGDYLEIIHLPECDSGIEEFEKLIESGMAYLKTENTKTEKANK